MALQRPADDQRPLFAASRRDRPTATWTNVDDLGEHRPIRAAGLTFDQAVRAAVVGTPDVARQGAGVGTTVVVVGREGVRGRRQRRAVAIPGCGHGLGSGRRTRRRCSTVRRSQAAARLPRLRTAALAGSQRRARLPTGSGVPSPPVGSGVPWLPAGQASRAWWSVRVSGWPLIPRPQALVPVSWSQARRSPGSQARSTAWSVPVPVAVDGGGGVHTSRSSPPALYDAVGLVAGDVEVHLSGGPAGCEGGRVDAGSRGPEQCPVRLGRSGTASQVRNDRNCRTLDGLIGCGCFRQRAVQRWGNARQSWGFRS